MLKGDLSGAGLPVVLAQLADGAATGCLHVEDPVDGQAQVHFRGGRVYAVSAPGHWPQLGSRLISNGALAPEALAEALEAQRTELQGWRLGELLVHLGYVDQPVVAAFVQEQVLESMSDLLLWTEGTWRFRVNERTREDVAPPVDVADLLVEVERRRAAWQDIVEVIQGVEAIPTLAARGGASDETAIDADAWALLCKVDGVRSVSALARDCGFTMYEAGTVVHTLVRAGLLEVDDEAPETLAPPADQDLAAAADRLLGALAPTAPDDLTAAVSSALIGDAMAAPGPDEDDVEGSINRVSQALSALLGPARSGEDVFAVPSRPAPPPPRIDPEVEAQAARRAERQARDSQRRARDAAELIAAQAALEAAKQEHEQAVTAEHEAVVVDLEQRREAARLEEQAAADERALAEAERVEAERAEAERAEIERIEAERAAAERASAERASAERAEAERIEAERAAAERAEAERAEAERAEAERAAAERAAAERAEAEGIEAERAATERAEAERAEAERAAAERAEIERIEAERIEAERVEAQRIDAQRIEVERADAEQVEAERAGAERIEAERAEAERVEGVRVETERVETELAREAAEEREYAEASREQAALAEIAAFAKAELSAAASSAPSAPPGSVAVAEAPAERELVEADDPEDAPGWHQSDTDTASLLRELSSLGLDDEPTPSPAPRQAPRATTPAAKKRKGIFGR